VKSKLIVNPLAGTDAAPDHLAAMNERLRQRIGTLDIVITVSEGDASETARQAVADGYDHLFVAGGDGTLNEALNGVASVEGGLEKVTFGVIPLGTGNDFATAALGLPEDVEAAIDLLLDGQTLLVDVGRLNDRYFVNVSAGGFLAEVSEAVNPRLKSLTGKLAYLIGGAQVLLEYDPVRAHIRRVDGTATANEIALYAFAVCNSRLVGGGRLIAPEALIDDGELDVCLIQAMPTVEFMTLLRRVSEGDHVDDERVAYFRTRELEIAFDRPIKVNTDGQVLEADRCCYRVMPRAARFLGARTETSSSTSAPAPRFP
jgi:diacylglycerol kinase (ATP)